MRIPRQSARHRRGAAAFDVALFRDGSIDAQQIATLKAKNDGLNKHSAARAEESLPPLKEGRPPRNINLVVDDFGAQVELQGGSEWQTVSLAASDFHNAAGAALPGWKPFS